MYRAIGRAAILFTMITGSAAPAISQDSCSVLGKFCKRLTPGGPLLEFLCEPYGANRELRATLLGACPPVDARVSEAECAQMVEHHEAAVAAFRLKCLAVDPGTSLWADCERNFNRHNARAKKIEAACPSMRGKFTEGRIIWLRPR